MTKKLPAFILSLLALAGVGKMIESQQAATAAALQTIAQVQAQSAARPSNIGQIAARLDHLLP